ncbi:hypothetical protein BSKO_08564 [Bryopsis sp. KO-2023]|nr:hypothetical protein BSKO_08564 [Bryopsis sp. KO-2023]
MTSSYRSAVLPRGFPAGTNRSRGPSFPARFVHSHQWKNVVRGRLTPLRCSVGEEQKAANKTVDVTDTAASQNGVGPGIAAEEKALAGLEEVAREEEIEFQGESVAAWIGAALAFGGGVWYTMGQEKAIEYFAGYLLEQSLSVDNLFVFILVFNFFKTPEEHQGKVLTYGIITAGVLRLVMIVLGVELIENFKPVLLFFAGLLIYSSYNLLVGGEDDDEDLNDNSIVKFCKSFMDVSSSYDGGNFFTVENGVKLATPLLLTLAVIELSDVVFAVDSIPAVFGVTLDPFIVYSSNLFAILSLRSLYGFVSVVMKELKYLDKSVALVLGFIGAKMLADFGGYHVSTEASLGVVALLLSGGVGASLLANESKG